MRFRERKKSCILLFTPQMTATARVGPGWSHKPGFFHGSTWVTEA